MDYSVCIPDCNSVAITPKSTPTQLDSLARDSTALFKWIYKVQAPANTIIRFNASIPNGKPGTFVTDDLTIFIIETAKFAEQSTTAAQAGSLAATGGTFTGNELHLLNSTAISGVSPAGQKMHHNEPERIGEANAAQIWLSSATTATNAKRWYTQPSAGVATIPAGNWKFWLCGVVNSQTQNLKLLVNITEVTGTGAFVRNILTNTQLDYQTQFHNTNVKCKENQNSGPNLSQQQIQNENRLRMDLWWDSSSTVSWFRLYYNATNIEGGKESKIEFKGSNVQNPFPSFYFNLDGKDFWISVVNAGPLHFFITADTRAIFRNVNTNATYGSILIEVNRTNTVAIHQDNNIRDVLLVQPNNAKELHFSTPATIPTRNTGTNNEGARPTPGTYDLNILLEGYDQNGGKLIKILYFGRVTIV